MIFQALKTGKIRILGSDVQVKIVDAIDVNESMGESCVVANTIKICKNMDVTTQEETLLHEVLHQIADKLNIKMSEKTIATLSPALYSVIKDNEKKGKK